MMANRDRPPPAGLVRHAINTTKHADKGEHVSSKQTVRTRKGNRSAPELSAINATRAFLRLSDTWDDGGTASQVVRKIRADRRNSPRFADGRQDKP
jgi:hypothetical protein